MTPLAKKLGLKPGMRVRLLHAPGGYWNLVGAEPDSLGVELLDVSGSGTEGDGVPADFIHLFATDLPTLRDGFGRARSGMARDGMVWASWPKKASGVPSEIGRNEVMQAGKEQGLVDIKVCAVDATWSGLKFVIPVDDRPPVGESGG